MEIVVIPCLISSYAYLIIDEKTNQGAVVDPVEPLKIMHIAKNYGVDVKIVLTTEHRWDHDGGNEMIKKLVPGIKIYGGSDNVDGCTDKVKDGDKLSLGDIRIMSLHTPCHAEGHISYYLTSKADEEHAVFTGDALFVAGCGKFIEGTAEQMYQFLRKLALFPKTTEVYCGHEYTVKNLQFALAVEPDNEKIKQKLSFTQIRDDFGLPTVPSTIEVELETNPFMRVNRPELQDKVGCKTPVDALWKIRQWEDNWSG